MMSGNRFVIEYSKGARRDLKKLAKSEYVKKADAILQLLMVDPFQNPPAYGVLSGDMVGCYSRRINIQHRVVYRVDENENIVEIVSCWTHYH
jgi:Txe/YoeB family toxin of toxin-antitoxin system